MSDATNGWDALISIAFIFGIVVIFTGWPWKRGDD